MQLILASQSFYRKLLLEKLGVPFTVQPADVDETEHKNEKPLDYVKRVAIAKATAISQLNPGAVVVAADTPVLVGRRILQTPATEDEAREMLYLQSGRRVTVPTVLVVADASGKVHHKVVVSWFKFKQLKKDEVEAYIASGNWQKASGAIKFDYVDHWVTDFYGSMSGAKGLPLYETTVLLARAGIKVQPFGA